MLFASTEFSEDLKNFAKILIAKFWHFSSHSKSLSEMSPFLSNLANILQTFLYSANLAKTRYILQKKSIFARNSGTKCQIWTNLPKFGNQLYYSELTESNAIFGTL